MVEPQQLARPWASLLAPDLWLRLAWWNTGLAPRAKRRESRRVSLQAIARLRSIGGADVAVLGETTDADATAVREAFPDGYQVRLPSDFTAVDDERWGVTVFFAPHVRVDACTVMRTSLDKSHKLNRHQWFFRISTFSFEPINMFVVHWPSRRENEGGLTKRVHLAGELKAELEHAKRGSPYAIALGDFNDEPFDHALSRALVAVRDRATSVRFGHLYNPFWSFMGDARPSNGGPSAPGTLRWDGGVESPWRTFDQMLFSSAFLESGGWHLPEDGVAVVGSANLGSGEHHPVACKIVARGKDGTL